MSALRRLAPPALAALALTGCHARSDDASTLTANEEAQLNEAAATVDAESAAANAAANAQDAANAVEVDTGNDTEQTS